MSLMMRLAPAALVLLVWGFLQAVEGVRQENKLKLISAAGVFVFLTAGAGVMMVFITRPL
ncbi:MAG: hypothetical protein HFG00_00735 [Oscillibacter sp.]|nr:hypothetical protein [Oscillibacter sp.]